MCACRISRPRKSIVFYVREMYDKLEALTEPISVSRTVHGCMVKNAVISTYGVLLSKQKTYV